MQLGQALAGFFGQLLVNGALFLGALGHVALLRGLGFKQLGDFCLRGLGGLGLLELALQCGDLLLQGDELWLGSSGSTNGPGLNCGALPKVR